MLYPFIAFTITLMVLLLLLNTSLSRLALDRPNHRSLHSSPIPRTGGLALMAGVLLIFVLSGLWQWVGLAGILVLLCIVDDVRGLSAKWRLLIHLLINAAFVVSMLDIDYVLPRLALILAITWMTNLYNFMDGSDGLAGGMTCFGFGTYGVAAYLSGDMFWAGVNAAIAASALAFLFFNFHPAKIFMGDTGSIPLGFLAGAIGGYGYMHNLWPIWLPVLVFAPFILDATVTLMKRIYSREKVWEAHRSHYYQRLVQMGWGHRRTAISEYSLMAVCAGSALALRNQPDMVIGMSLASILVTMTFFMYVIDRRWKSFNITEFRSNHSYDRR